MAGTVLAFDFGERRIGVAVGEMEVRSSHPLETIAARDNRTRFERIDRIIQEWQPERLVVGLPAPAEPDHPMNERCRRFARQLEGRFHLPADLVDESYSSAQADLELAEAGLGAARRKAVLDRVAAQSILRTWYEHH